MIDLKNEVINEFIDNIEGIASDFVACFELKHKKEIQNLSDSLFRWSDFRLEEDKGVRRRQRGQALKREKYALDYP
jgi:hypothetical protein